ncbi:hypothetical protein BsWGS_18428 [Bradybaena similaris]
MQTTCFPVYILLFLLMEIHILGQQHTSPCPSGWFGQHCRHRCNCEASTTCGMDGQCPGTETCKKPYFGPGCQFVDLLTSQSSSSTPTFLRDNNHTTCNPNTDATSVRMFLKRYLPFTWYRIHVKNNSSLFSVQTIVNNGTICRSQHYFALQKTVFDVWCYLGIEVISVTIQGAIVASICTVQISGGRNVALKQNVYQTSDYSSAIDLHLVDAHNAVDGDTSQEYSAGSCSQTDFQSTAPYWHLTFDRPYLLHRVVIYSRKDHGEWLDGFRLETFNLEGNISNWYKDTAYKHWSVYDFNLVPWQPVKALRITTDSTGKQIRRALSLCEVQTMGEPYCGITSYGLGCEKTCKCMPNIKCSSITGHCPSNDHVACPAGTFGQLCRSPCAENCQYNVCDATSGHCHQCIPGYTGDFCDKACPAGRFGPACSLHCSGNCKGTCNHTTGVCSCQGTFTGSLCSECAVGWYGAKCHLRCSQLCLERICDQLLGTCLSCIGERSGDHCQSCPRGHFGALCDRGCSAMCTNVTCDSISGACFSCAAGYTGEYCSHENESSLLSLWMVPLLLPLLAVLLCCWIEGRKKRPQAEEGTSKVNVAISQKPGR